MKRIALLALLYLALALGTAAPSHATQVGGSLNLTSPGLDIGISVGNSPVEVYEQPVIVAPPPPPPRHRYGPPPPPPGPRHMGPPPRHHGPRHMGPPPHRGPRHAPPPRGPRPGPRGHHRHP